MSDLDDAGIDAKGFVQVHDVAWVRGDDADVVVVPYQTGRDQSHRRVNDVSGSGLSTQQPRSACKCSVERDLVTLAKRPHEMDLATTVPPGLRNGARWHLNDVIAIGSDAQQCPNLPVISSQRNQCAGIEDK